MTVMRASCGRGVVLKERAESAVGMPRAEEREKARAVNMVAIESCWIGDAIDVIGERIRMRASACIQGRRVAGQISLIRGLHAVLNQQF